MPSVRHSAFFLLALLTAVLSVPQPSPAEDIHSFRCKGILNGDQVIVYYFTRKFGCQSCAVVETALPETIERNFGAYLQTGRLSLCVVNLDDPANRHYLEMFDIIANSVVIAQKKAGQVCRFKNIEAIWDVSSDAEAISHLLLKEVSSFLPES